MLHWLPLICSLASEAAPKPLHKPVQHASVASGRLSFDQSLDQLERKRVITPQERSRLEHGINASPGAVVPAKDLQRACDQGALTPRECETGIARPLRARSPMPRVHFQGQSQLDLRRVGQRRANVRALTTPLTVPVSALLAGSGGSFSLESVFAVTPRPLSRPGNGDRRLLFPVVGQAVTSSGFGWRLHPILGNWLMHAGRDFAAPQGSPVVAALSGRVVSSGLAGGYGITVVLEHQAPRRQTLYGHLSELYVKTGQKVSQGDVIGRVGSTGLSTGPHLHFELRRPNGGGWLAENPGDLDMSHLVKTMKDGKHDAVSILMAQLLHSLERPEKAQTGKG